MKSQAAVNQPTHAPHLCQAWAQTHLPVSYSIIHSGIKYSPPLSLYWPIAVAQTLSPSNSAYSPQSHKYYPPLSLHCLPFTAAWTPTSACYSSLIPVPMEDKQHVSKLSPLFKFGFLSVWFLPGSSSFASAAKVFFLPCKGGRRHNGFRFVRSWFFVF